MGNDVSDLLKKFITGDESWVYGYDIETKAQSFQWKRPEKPRSKTKNTSSSIKCKRCAYCFFRLHNGMVHYDFLYGQ